MPTTLSTFRSRLRQDLHDEDATAYRWTDAVLQRHIERAVREYSFADPISTKSTLTTTAGSREVSLASLTSRIYVERVEYPVDYWPKVWPKFSVWADTLTLLIDDEPRGTNNLYVYWGKAHTVDGNGSSVPVVSEDLITMGAAAYALIEWANYAPNRVNVGGKEVWRDYLTWGTEQLRQFHEALDKLDRRKKLRVRQIHPF